MFNPRKLSALAVMMVVLLLLLTGCASAPKLPKTAAEAEIQSGITGKTVTITDEAQVKQVLDAFPTDYPDGQKETESTYGYRYAVAFRDANNQEIGRCTVRNDNQLVCGERVYAIDCTPIVAQIEAAISSQK